MAKIEQMLRLKFIEDFLRSRKNRGASYEEIQDYLEKKYEQDDIDLDHLKFTKRTFLRDKVAISKVLKTNIIYRRSTNTYAIDDDNYDEFQEDVFDNLLLVEAFRNVKGKKNIMLFEQRKSRGLHWINGLVHAITHQKIVTLKYTKFWEGVSHDKVLEPYAVKEFKNRWYLLAHEKNDEKYFLKTFGLDRISELEISPSSFKPKQYDIEKDFENSFGIISTLDETPEEIVLSFDADQGKYIKTLPLHHSQEILVDNDKEFRIKLILVPTFDFEREILSLGSSVKIISPESFRKSMRKEVEEMLINFN
ncbi:MULTISPECIES: WYL domain-containing protein [unclassified Kaistella]|uniref:WYL domain-containing protein n=1 Tax=unclassified Kaistella TaxID=2762626 RepID=UPI0027327811|nr:MULTISPECIES: WYL domain-containing protein [unclassified Kaistella]MDP2454144.1 WYL domain-containing protein [Kaistella sp. SH11-4b]MDP2457785.1 WYL domain-containing protein [Kaistella sp. SH40-3]MDP2460543.1 WYL domain-containing protein [Kaistella sp. SH19-2b]